jgi:hypothetical protein
VHAPTLAISAAVVAVVLGSRALAPRLPGPLFAVVATVVASAAFDFAGRGIGVVGPVTGGLPALRVPAMRADDVWALLPVLVHPPASLRADLDRHGLADVIPPARVFEKLHDALAAIGGSSACGPTLAG